MVIKKQYIMSLSLFLFLLSKGYSKNPIIIVPMMYGTNLYVTYDHADQLSWYCPKHEDHELIWINRKYFVLPLYNCFFQLLTNYFDNETKTYLDFPNTTITIPEFGSEEGVKYIDYGLFKNFHLHNSLVTFFDFLRDKGYESKKNMFVAPYDWRLAPLGVPKFWPSIIKLIEDAYEKNDEEKVILYGFSCGGSLLIRLLSKYVTPEWKEKYIKKVILLAPSFGGTGDSIDSIYNTYSPLFFIFKNRYVKESASHFPVTHCHLLNHIIYDFPVIVSPEKNYTASQVPLALRENHRIPEDAQDMVNYCAEEYTSKPTPYTGVRTYLIFNTKIKTKLGLNYSLGLNNEKHEFLYSGGDGTIPEGSMKWACKNWDTSKAALTCIDINQSDPNAFIHASMGVNSAVYKLIYKLIENDETKDSGTEMIELPEIKNVKDPNIEFEL